MDLTHLDDDAWWRLRKPQEFFFNVPAVEDPKVHLGQLKRFSLKELQVATDNFNNKNILGRGVFRKFYKGRLSDGSLVAVQWLKEERTQHREIQFQTEVQLISMAVHRNLLRLRGFCMTPKERLLVYPYMANGSVASRLREERPVTVPLLDWPTRKLIALGSARGLSYLHDHCDPKIIHRDVKAANILLDEEFKAVIGGLSLVKLMDYKDTHVTTDVRGSIGHIAPEYLSTGKSSEKTDVFGYGIMLLELITGQRAFDVARLANDDDVMLLDWVKGLLKDKKLEMLVDPDLKTNYVATEVEQLIQVALQCTQTMPLERPKMSDVVRMLEGNGLAERWDGWQNGEVLRHMPDLSPPHCSVVEDPKVHLGQLKLNRFSLEELQVATDNFKYKNILGRGGFGKLYKGRLADGSLVAVKRLTEGRTQCGELQFHTEIEMSSMSVHRNLLCLRGFCMTPKERLLVYPYMANGSLASRLRERPDTERPLDWTTRKLIALGSARGLSYLHDHCDPKIIHRDVKAANILLDEEFEAVVGGFGLAKLMDGKDTQVMTAVRGTLGHIAPEYLSTGNASEKTDVFGYGIMLLELITGQRTLDLARLANDDDMMLLDWVKGLLKEKKLEMLVDPDLKKTNYVATEVEHLIQVALQCTQATPLERPKMSDIVRMLEDDELGERWDEWLIRHKLYLSPVRNSDLVIVRYDSTDDLRSVELSSPR